jgi:hypothetical protein
MFEHEGKTFQDELCRPYGLARRAVRNYYENECEIIIVTGMPEGIGKSAYVHHGLADVQGFLNCHDKDLMKWMYKPIQERPQEQPIWKADYEGIKNLIKYPPDQVVNFLMDMLTREVRIPMWHWDDGGTHLASMSYNDPFVVAFMEFLPLARTVCGLVVISSPVEEWVLKKLHTASGVIHCPIIKLGSNDHIWRPRQCKPYRKVKNIMAKHWYPQYQWQDEFSAIMPDSFYKWYKPMRDHYTKLAVAKMRLSLDKKKASGDSTFLDEEVLGEIERTMAKTNDKLKEFKEVVAQHTDLAIPQGDVS